MLTREDILKQMMDNTDYIEDVHADIEMVKGRLKSIRSNFKRIEDQLDHLMDYIASKGSDVTWMPIEILTNRDHEIQILLNTIHELCDSVSLEDSKDYMESIFNILDEIKR